MGEKDKTAPEAIVIAKLIVSHPYLVALGSFGLCTLLGAVAFMGFGFDQGGGNGSFVAIGEQLVQEAQVVEELTRAKDNTNKEPLLSEEFDQVILFYKSDNVFSPENRAKIREIERRILEVGNHADYCYDALNETSAVPAATQGFCTPPLTSLNLFPLDCDQTCIENKIRADYVRSTPEGERYVVSVDASSRPVQLFFGRDFNFQTLVNPATRTILKFGGPLKGFDNLVDRPKDQMKLYNEYFGKMSKELAKIRDEYPELELSYLGEVLTSLEIAEIINKDFLLAAVSFVVVFGVVTFQTGSLFLAVFGMAHVVTSYLGAYFIYRVVLQIEISPPINNLALFIILGIGADDIFVFLDAWKQSAHEGPEITGDLAVRMTVVYKRAAYAMLVTSFTTFVAFVATSQAPIPMMASFGIMAANTVLVNFLLVITYFPAIVIIWNQKLAHQCCFKKKAVRGQASRETSEDVSSEGEAPALPVRQDLEGDPIALEDQSSVSELQESETDKSASDKSASDAEITKGALVIALYDFDARADDEMSVSVGDCIEVLTMDTPAGDDWLRGRKGSAKGLIPRSHIQLRDALVRPAESNIEDFRCVERFFYKTYAPLLYKLRWGVVLFFSVLFIAFIVGATQLRPPDAEPSGLPKNAPVTKAIETLDKDFVVDEEVLVQRMAVVFGTTGEMSRKDPTGKKLDPNNVDITGVPIYDDSFDLASERVQRAVLDACGQIASKTCNVCGEEAKPNNLVLPGENSVSCLMDELRVFTNGSFPIARVNFTATVKAFLNTREGADYEQLIGFDTSGRPTYLILQFSTPIARRPPNKVLRSWYELWSAEVALIPKGDGMGNTVFASTLRFSWMRTTEVLFRAVYLTILISIILAYIVLSMATQNIIIATLATLVIVVIVCGILTVMVLIGWDLGFTEAIGAMMLVGLAVDYTVHLATSFNEAESLIPARHDRSNWRFDKVRHALTEMGVSVLGGAVTTMGSGLVLFFTQLPFFQVFGRYIFITISLAFAVSITYFMALLMCVGPLGKQGDLRYLCLSAAKRTGLKKENTTIHTSESSTV